MPAASYEANAEAIVEAVNIANALREMPRGLFRKSSGAKLDDLPAGIAQNSRECVLARAFNFGCRVAPVTPGGSKWAVSFPRRKEKYAAELAKLLGTEAIKVGGEWRVPLPTRIAQIARRFDNYFLPSRYYA